jgi:hypothetical protein
MGLAGELRHMPDPRPRGVAVAERLLTEPSSVLFTAVSSAEVSRAARDAVDKLRGDDVPINRGTARESLVRTTSTSLRSTPTPAAAAAEHHFHRPTVAPLPSRSPVDAATW